MATPTETQRDKQDKKHDSITIIYLGEPRELEYEAHEPVKDALSRAEDLFGISANRHLMALFDEAGNEITDEEQTIKKAGVKPGEKVLLGQSQAKGG